VWSSLSSVRLSSPDGDPPALTFNGSCTTNIPFCVWFSSIGGALSFFDDFR
jgi:hypothetical protein